MAGALHAPAICSFHLSSSQWCFSGLSKAGSIRRGKAALFYGANCLHFSEKAALQTRKRPSGAGLNRQIFAQASNNGDQSSEGKKIQSSNARDQGGDERTRVRVAEKEGLMEGKEVARARRTISPEERERRTRMEDELKDARTWFDYLLPRQLRRLYFAAGAVSCTVASVIALSKLLQNPALEIEGGGKYNLAINLVGLIFFAGAYVWEGSQAEKRVERRKKIREAQIRIGDREVYVNKEGEKMSRLKPVDDNWILRRLDRWGDKDKLPMIGPKKGALLQGLVAERAPQTIVEVGTFLGYSAIRMGQVLPSGGRIISYESDFKWFIAAKRFVWQAKMADKIDVRWSRAQDAIPQLQTGSLFSKPLEQIDFLFLDAKPFEYLDYLLAAEPLLKSGAVVVADNAGIFSKSLVDYLNYVRGSGQYESEYIECALEYRDDVPDGMEVSRYKGLD